MRSNRPIGLLPVWAALFAACAPDPSASEESPPATVELLRIQEFGCDDRCPGPPLERPYQVHLDAQGQIWVLDWYPPHIRSYDENGVAKASMGQRGQGPGEFDRPPVALYSSTSGDALVWDALGARAVAFDSSGELRNTREMEHSALGHWATAPNYLLVEDRPGGRFGLNVPMHQVDRVRFRRIDLERAAVEELFWLDIVATFGSRVEGLTAAVAEDGRVALGRIGGDYHIVLLRADGTAYNKLSREVATPLRSPERLAVLRDLRKRAGLEGDPEPYERHFHAGTLRFDNRERLWVLTSRGAPGHSTVFDVFSTESGEFIGSARIPEAPPGEAYLWEVRDDRLVAVLEVDGEPRLTAWRVQVPRD